MEQPLRTVQADAARLLELRGLRIDALLRANPRGLDLDRAGSLIIRGEVLAVSPSPSALAAAQQRGFVILRRETAPELGLDLVVLAPPSGLGVDQALRSLRRADGKGRYDLNHVYLETAAPSQAGAPPPSASGASKTPIRIGLIDTGADASHPGLAGLSITQRGFASGGVRPADHATAVASVAAGARPGSTVFIADVYGDGSRGGSAEAIVQALAWMGSIGAPVVNVSLVGPPNLALQTAIAALDRKGVLIVAAVGNDGPAAPASYPASYPQVVAVTGVDARGKVLVEAGRALHVDFAALGAEVTVAGAGRGQAKVRGTSFAAPVVAAALAGLYPRPLPERGQQPIQALARQAKDLGSRGRDRVYGYGLVER